MNNLVFIVVNNAWYAYNFRLNLAKAIQNSGYLVAFISPWDEKYTAILKKDFIVFNVEFDPKGVNPFKDFASILKLYKIYKKQKPKYVLNFTIKPNIYSSLVCRILKIPCISNITGLGTIFIKENFLTKIAELLYKIALKNNRIVFFQNNDDKSLFIKKKLIDETKSDLLPGSGVDTDKFSPVKNSKNTKFIFLFIARLIKDKGICELIEAVQILSKNRDDFSLYLLGETGVKNKTAISKDELEIWLKNDFINYLGKSDDVRDTICGSDCVVLPSYREGTPRSLLEAASMAKPIVTTNVTGCKEVVDDGINGLLCEVKNAKDLAQKMEKMLNLSDEERRRMGTSGREKMIKRFDEKIVISKYLEIIL